MTIVRVPTRWKAAHEVSPIAGVRRTPPARTSISPRGAVTLKTPALSSRFPFAPVSRSMRAVSRGAAALGGSGAATVDTSPVLTMSVRTNHRHFINLLLAADAAGMDARSWQELAESCRFSLADRTTADDRSHGNLIFSLTKLLASLLPLLNRLSRCSSFGSTT
jgi:hypothetical protein